jgi:putative ABC transport system permease protein
VRSPALDAPVPPRRQERVPAQASNRADGRGIVVAITAFGLLRTIVDAWYAGANASSSARLVTRSAVSLVFSLPLTYAQKIRQVEGVKAVSWANWFGGVYISERNFFPQFAIDAATYLDMYPEFVLPAAERKAFVTDRKGAVGRTQARRAVWLEGGRHDPAARHDLFGQLELHAARHLRRGQGRRPVDDVLPLGVSQRVDPQAVPAPRRSGRRVRRAAEGSGAGAEVSAAIDAMFKNSLAETLTETEKAFQLSFVAMTEAILLAIQAVSFVVIVIIMAVMANTMAMTARERGSEYATLKALGSRAASSRV